MELKSNMIVRDLKSGDMWLLDESTARPGQYGSGVVWTARKVMNDVTYKKDGLLKLGIMKEQNIPIDSISDAEKYEYVGMAKSITTWSYDNGDSARVEKELMEAALKKVIDKLSPLEQALLRNYYRGR